MVVLNVTAAARQPCLTNLRPLAREGFDGWAVDVRAFGADLVAEFVFAAGGAPILRFVDADGADVMSILCGGAYSAVSFRGEYRGAVEDLDGDAAIVAAALFGVARTVREIEAEAEALAYHRAQGEGRAG